MSATWDGFPLSHKTRKDGAPSCPRVVCASMSEGRSRLHRRERNLAGRRGRTTRTSWIVNSRFAAEGARNGNEKGKLFGTLRPRSGQAQELKSCASRNVRGRGRPRHAIPPRHTRFAPQSILRGCRRWAAVCPSHSLSFGCVVRCDGTEGEFTDPNGAPTEKPEPGFEI